jgi:threonine/homoserine/homoserine lactone efflux protein
MTIHDLVLFGLVYLLATASPGPGIAAIIARVLSYGTSGIVGFIAGFVIGDLIWFSLAATGMAALAQTAHTLFVAVKFAGAGYLLYLAYRLWTAPVRQIEDLSDRSDRKAWRLFIGGVTLTLGNPKVMVFFMALLPTVIDLNDLTLPAFCQVAIAICVILSSVLTLYTIAAMRARRFFQAEHPARLLNRVSGTVMAGTAVAVATR